MPSEDMTYCVSECKNKEKCFRNPANIALPQYPHSYADFGEACEDYVPESEGHGKEK